MIQSQQENHCYLPWVVAHCFVAESAHFIDDDDDDADDIAKKNLISNVNILLLYYIMHKTKPVAVRESCQ